MSWPFPGGPYRESETVGENVRAVWDVPGIQTPGRHSIHLEQWEMSISQWSHTEGQEPQSYPQTI